MLDITGNDIKDLNDTDLRRLIGLLCEAELSYSGLPTAGVTSGGDQNAPDGGIDVRVEVSQAPHPDSYIPRARTGFQVKKPDMPRAKIIEEMKPKGVLRESIKDLVNSSGAYIIVSSQGSTADTPLENRVNAMREALNEVPNASKIKVDFYDRERVAGWVRSHPAIVLWVREKTGRPIPGWRPYGNWANCPEGIKSEYLSDNAVRFHNRFTSNPEGMSGVAGILAIRNLLHQPASSVRLTGLSGVGKTRLLQALFDDRIGENPLNESQVFYTDIGDSPKPDPRTFAEQLMALRKTATLVVDNCPPDLHRRLTSMCTAPGSLVSLITVEYDVQEDQPEETEVFRLEPASIELIEKFISASFPYVNQVNARTIAKFSGGNARIAIFLAKTVKPGESLANLKDKDLFDRLFHQKNEPDKDLLRAAEVCSLVYSFECVTDDGEDSELRFLNLLAEMSVRQLYGHISELKRRELIQQRSVWRAVLPPAIANTLATRALENIPHNEIRRAFELNGSERLLQSFSRRLSYLHESDKAREIAKMWLSDNGLLADINNLNTLGISLFKNISPIEPEAAITSIEKAVETDTSGRFLSRDNPNHIEFARLLRSFAYDKTLFARSTDLLCHFALTENPRENYHPMRDLLKSLFYIHRSGTHATAEQRLNVITRLITSGDENQIRLAFELLDATLETRRASPYYDFEFGAHPRDYGFQPKNREDAIQWFTPFVSFTVEQTTSESKSASQAKSLLARKFKGLWINAGMFKELEGAANRIIEKGDWSEGWVAVKSTLRFDNDRLGPDSVSRLNNLEILLAPGTLIDRARLYALSRYHYTLDLVDVIENESKTESHGRVKEITRSLGQDVVNDEAILTELLPELLSADGVGVYSFGQGLADGSAQPLNLWSTFRQKIFLIDTNHRRYQLLRGFLNSISNRNPDVANELLDDVVEDTELGVIYPYLQTSVPLDDKAVARLELSLESEIAPIWAYENLTHGRVHETLSDEDLCHILKLISSKPDGEIVAIKMLGMSLHRSPDEEPNVSNIIVVLGQELALSHKFSRDAYQPDLLDHNLGRIIELCFINDTAANAAKELCEKLVKAFANYDIHSMDYAHVLRALVGKQPRAFLDAFFGDEIEFSIPIDWALLDSIGNRSNPISEIDEDFIIEWCEENPVVRYPKVAAVIVPYLTNDQDKRFEWTPLAKQIIDHSTDPIMILNQFKSSFNPNSVQGSLAESMQKRVSLINDLKDHENSLVIEWAASEEVELEDKILALRKAELESNSSRYERFE